MKKPWTRLVLAISLDGRLALAHGGKTPLGGEGDRYVLEEALAWSDITLLGGRTLRIHRNTCLIREPELIKKRTIEGRSEQPIAMVISTRKDFCTDWPFFHAPIHRWLLSPKKLQKSPSPTYGFDRELIMKEKWSETLPQLTDAGISRLLVLGGAQLIGSLLKEDQIDELQLTLTPKLLGGKYSWIPNEINNLPVELSNPNAWIINSIKRLSNNELMLKYLRKRSLNTLY